MPNRNQQGDYRYGYQGEYAEKEPELGNGVNSFQLRLWDARIGRWLTTDPYGQFASPYLGMGNNPILLIDPDGGCVGDDCPREQLDTVYLTGSGGGSGLQPHGYTAGWLFNQLTSFRVDDLAKEAGVQGQGIVFQRQVGAAFENHALNSFNLGKNSIRFPAPGRAARGGRPTVVPDGVRDIKVFGSNGKSALYPASSFFEVKKRQGIISLKSDNYQTLGIVDAAANSTGGRVGIGSVTFVTTSNTIIGQDVLKYAQKHGVQVYQAVAFEYRKSGRVTYTPAIKLTINKNPSFPNPLISWPTPLKF